MKKGAVLLLILLIGCIYLEWHFGRYKQSLIPEQYEKQTINIEGYVASIVNTSSEIGRYDKKLEQTASFEFIVNKSSIDWQPQKIKLSWVGAPTALQPGDNWNLQVKLMRPRNYNNPGSFDVETFCLYNHISATGYVIPNQTQQYLGNASHRFLIAKLRQGLLTKLDAIPNLQYKGIIIALSLGDKSRILKQQNKLLQVTGVAHLMSISGMHIGMVACMFFTMAVCLIRRFATYSCQHNSYNYAVIFALFAACGYAQISGFALATQRATVMLGCASIASLQHRKISAWSRFNLALLLLLVLDPFIFYSPGFWLSFLAVAALLYSFTNRFAKLTWMQRLILPQLLIGLVLLSLSFGVFGQTASVGLLANLVAIPCVTILILPLCLFGLIFLPVPSVAYSLFTLSDKVLSILMKLLEYCSSLKTITYVVPDKYGSILLVIATISTMWIFAPRGIPGRHWAILAFVPLFFPKIAGIPQGVVRFTLLDVGQGLAVFLQTTNHSLVYDAGAKLNEDFDLGEKVVLPFLQRKGIKRLDVVMISHSDNDHIGGAQSLIDNLPTDLILLNDPEKLNHNNIFPCLALQQWQWDGVTFTILHPQPYEKYRKRNNQSCVLQIQAGSDTLLLTGDIEREAEYNLIARYGSQLQARIMLIPHHGSKTSSSLEFIQTVQPQYAMVSAGYKNQYSHPRPEVMSLYAENNITVLNSAQVGAISIDLGIDKGELRINSPR